MSDEKTSIFARRIPAATTRPIIDWRLFAAADAAALAAGSTANASIIYVNPANKPDAKLATPGAQSTSVGSPFTVDGVAVNVAAYAIKHSGAFLNGVFVSGPNLKWAHSGIEAVKYDKGQLIAGGDQTFAALRNKSTRGNVGGGFTTGKTVGYAGFKLPAAEGGGEGWMRFQTLDRNADGYPDEIRAIDWAYNDAGGTILAGQGITAVPEPTATALLALGSAGVLAWRRRRADAGSQR